MKDLPFLVLLNPSGIKPYLREGLEDFAYRMSGVEIHCGSRMFGVRLGMYPTCFVGAGQHLPYIVVMGVN